jgi:tRNA A-37 threonylcarbamoyl transferase component Bud32
MKLPFIVADSYKAERLLGEGANTWVFDAVVTKSTRQLQAGQRIALKLYKVEQLGELFKQRLTREVYLGQHLSHPNLVKIYDAGSYDVGPFSLPYVVMELVEGTTLKTLIENSYSDRYVESEVLSIFQDILSALHTIHRQGFLHRDIHPENIMLTKEGRAILMDLGLVADTGETAMTPEWEIVGARRYLAPECLWKSRRARTTASDLYSLASTLYHLATGHLVHHRNIRYADYFYALLHERPILPSKHNSVISPWLSLILMGLLSAEPTERIQEAELLRRIVKSLSENRIVTIKIKNYGTLDQSFWMPGAGYEVGRGWTWQEHGRALGPSLSWETEKECLDFLNSGYGDKCVSLEMPDNSSRIMCKEMEVARLYPLIRNLFDLSVAFGPWFCIAGSDEFLVAEAIPKMNYDQLIHHQIESTSGISPLHEDLETKTSLFVHFQNVATYVAQARGAPCLTYKEFLDRDADLASKSFPFPRG